MVDMSRPCTPLPPPLDSRPFLLCEAEALGVSRSRLRSSDILSLGTGVFVSREVELTPRRVIIARARAHPQGIVTGVSAAVFHRMPLPAWLTPESPLAPTSLAFKKPRRATRSTGIDAYIGTYARRDVETIPLAPLSTVRGEHAPGARIAVASRARTWLSLIPLLPFDFAVALADHLLREPRLLFEPERTGPYCTPTDLDELLLRYPGIPGIVRARHAKKYARVGSDSIPETRGRLAFIAGGLPEPALNVTIRDASGRKLGTPDYFWEDAGVAAEYDGAHHRELEQFTADRDKSTRLRTVGIEMVRLYRTDLSPPIRSLDDSTVMRNLARSNAVRLAAAVLERRAVS